MPLTFPAHAAAVLPLHRLAPRLHPTALVAGSCAPDLAYVLFLPGVGSHQPAGLLTFGVPAGVALFLWAELLVLPALARVLPRVRGVQLARFARTRGLPRDGWALVPLAVLLGAATHLLWDGLTHPTLWPAREFDAPLRLPWLTVRRTTLLQHASTLLGTLAVLVYLARRHRELPPAGDGSLRGTVMLLGPALLGAAAAFVAVRTWQAGTPAWRLWSGLWSAIGAGMLALTLACAARRPWRREGPPAEPASPPRTRE